MQGRIIMFSNLVTEIQSKLKCSLIGTHISFLRDMRPKTIIYLSIPPQNQKPLQILHPFSISLLSLAGKAICRDKCLWVEQASQCEKVINRGWWLLPTRIYSCSTMASQYPVQSETSSARHCLWHLRHSGDNFKTLYKFSICCRCWCHFTTWLQLIDWQNTLCGHAVHLITFMEDIRCVFPSWLRQFVELLLLPINPFHALLHRFRHYPHCPAGIVNFAQRTLLGLFIMLIFPILPIVGSCKISLTVDNSNHHLLNSRFLLSVCHSCIFILPCIILIFPTRCLWMFNSLSCHISHPIKIILDQFGILFIA